MVMAAEAGRNSALRKTLVRGVSLNQGQCVRDDHQHEPERGQRPTHSRFYMA